MSVHRLSIAAGTTLLGLCAALGCFAETPEPQYKIKEDVPPTGSRIREDVVRSKNLPLNLTYHQLSSEQRAMVHGWYESIAPGDEPPYPAEGLEPIFKAVRKGHARRPVNGSLFVIATVEPNGVVSDVKSYGSLDSKLANYVASVVVLTKFKPAFCGGRPCRMDFPLRIGFGVK